MRVKKCRFIQAPGFLNNVDMGLFLNNVDMTFRFLNNLDARILNFEITQTHGIKIS